LGISSKRAVIYTRVSSTAQEYQGTSLSTQSDGCITYANSKEYRVVKVFKEVWTGSVFRQRPLLTELRTMARHGEFDILIIYAFDRLSRKQTHLAIIIEEMENLGNTVECVTEKFDQTAQGQFMMSARAYVAEVEREKILDRTHSGRLKRVHEKGKLIPGFKPVFGYDFDSVKTGAKGNYIVNDEDAPLVRRIFSLYKNGMKIRGIANLLNDEGVPTPTRRGFWVGATIYRMLTDRTYIGEATTLKWDSRMDNNGIVKRTLKPIKEHVVIPVPAIIDLNLFDEVQSVMALNKVDSSRNNPDPEDSLLRSGFVKCGYCGRVMAVRRWTKKASVTYTCQAAFRNGRTCISNQISTKVLDPLVWLYVGELIKDFSLVEEAIAILKKQGSPHTTNFATIEQSIKNANIQLEQYAEDLRAKDGNGQFKIRGMLREQLLNDISQTEKYIDELCEEKTKIEEGKFEWEHMQKEIDAFIAWCLSARETYETASYEEKRRALRMLGITVLVYQEKDTTHKRYDIRVSVPAIVSHKLCSEAQFLYQNVNVSFLP